MPKRMRTGIEGRLLICRHRKQVTIGGTWSEYVLKRVAEHKAYHNTSCYCFRAKLFIASSRNLLVAESCSAPAHCFVLHSAAAALL